MNSAFIVEQHGNHIYKLNEKNHCIKLNSTVTDLKKKLHEKEKY